MYSMHSSNDNKIQKYWNVIATDVSHLIRHKVSGNEGDINNSICKINRNKVIVVLVLVQ